MDALAELLPVELILRDVLVIVDDESLRKGLTKGTYINIINKALEKLAINTYYNEEPPMDVPMPKNFRWKLPDNFFNIAQLYAFNGDCCDVTSSANIYWKRNFNNAPDGNGYTALNKGDQQSHPDPYFRDWNWGLNFGTNNRLFANVQNGYLMFSNSCSGYSSFRVVYNGFGGVLGDKPLIPRPLREITIDLAVYGACEILKNRFPKSNYGATYQTTYEKMYNKLTGTWWQAELFVKSADGWMKNSRESYGSVPQT